MLNFVRNLLAIDDTVAYSSVEENEDGKKQRLCGRCFCFSLLLNLFLISNVVGYAIARYSVNPTQFASITDSLNFEASNDVIDTPPPIIIESVDNINSDSTQLLLTNINPQNMKATTDSTDINALFTSNPLDTQLSELQLKKLKVNVDMITVNENDGLQMTQNGPYYGAYSFIYKYPENDGQTYATNQIRRQCYNIKFEDGSIFEHVIIDIKFNKFELERGFDRIIIREYNDSEVNLPLSYSGHHIHLSKTYLVEQLASKTLCIEFQSDESITDFGYEYAVNIYYDACTWTPYDQCFMESTDGQRWSRGPFFNGKCGVGIMSKHRANVSANNAEISQIFPGILQCSDDILQTYGPEYCIKRKCVDWNNLNDTPWPPSKRPLRNWFRFEEYYNGRGRLDPTFNDPFRIYRSRKNNLIQKNNKIDLDMLQEKLVLFAEQIASEHYDENVLKYAILDRDHRNITSEYLGARTLHSLINGRPMVIATVGDSVTSGHDNMFMSTYAMQVQSRLRPFFVNTGNKGAAFIARNIAEGGGPDSSNQGWVVRSLATETFPSLFSKLNDIINNDENNYNIWYTNSGIISKMDIFLWEQYFCKTGQKSYVELDIRQAATMNSIWAALVPNRGVKVKSTCNSLDSLLHGMPSWNNCDKYGKYLGPIVPKYLNKMGFGLIKPEYGMRAACNIIVNGTKSGGYKGSDDGEPNVCCIPDGSPEGQLYSYVGYWMRTNWHPNSRGNRVNADIVSYWIINSAIKFLKKYKSKMETFNSENNLNEFNIFLKDKSGNWGEQIVKSIIHGKYDEFIEPQFCGMDSDQPWCKSIPFGLTNENPKVYNTHQYLNEYILYNVSLTPTIEQHISSIGWKWDGVHEHAITAKKGYEGRLDEFPHLQISDQWYKNKYMLWKNDTLIDECCDEFEQFLISNKYYLQIVVKIPLYGVGNINIFGGGYHCDGGSILRQKMHIYANKLETFMENNNELGVLLKNWKNCTFTGLETGTKYVITYVPYNMSTNIGSFTAMFVAAY